MPVTRLTIVIGWFRLIFIEVDGGVEERDRLLRGLRLSFLRCLFRKIELDLQTVGDLLDDLEVVFVCVRVGVA